MLDELVTAGGTAVVGAMATDSWMLARTRVAELFRRRGGEERQQAIEGQLDSNARLVAEAEDGDQVRQTLLPLWQLELRSLLRRDPAAAEELRALIEEVRPAGNSESKWVQRRRRTGQREGVPGAGRKHRQPPPQPRVSAGAFRRTAAGRKGRG
ncbi:hypothetical protein RB199_07160 [Streptomyces libani]